MPALWLRERARTSDQIDIKTQQRLFNPHELSENLSIKKILWGYSDNIPVLIIYFSDGYKCSYSKDYLDREIFNNIENPKKEKWVSNFESFSKYRWNNLDDDEELLEAVADYLRYGFLFIKGVPKEKESIKLVARKFGFIHETNFGKVFDIYSRSEANDLAYTALPLGPHTDNPYRHQTPGIQLLHCLQNSSQGGFSTLVDGMACLDILKNEDPKSYDLLAEVSVYFSFEDQESSYRYERPILEVDKLKNFVGIHYSPRLDKLPLIDEKIILLYHLARKKLAKLLSHPDYEMKLKLKEGDCLIINNNRVLHGRTAYNTLEGKRFLQGCYINSDGPESLYRKLKHKKFLNINK